MIKPNSKEISMSTDSKIDVDEPIVENNDERLKLTMERKQRALAERDRLQIEPDVSDEYVR